MVSLTPKKLNTQTFLDSFTEQLFSLSPSRKYLVAYSGGMDSHVLLQLMADAKQTHSLIKVRALHVNHALQKEAESWVSHCQKQSTDLNIPLEISTLALNLSAGESLEAVARKGRYQALIRALQQDEVLLTAHHQRDQAETFLLQLFRGAGVQGLASMPNVIEFGLGQHARPLLNESYETLQAYAQQKELQIIQDPSNKDNRFERNFLRNIIFPSLREHWQGIDKTISRSANIQAETKTLLDEMAEQILLSFPCDNNNSLSISHLVALSQVKQKLVLRYWIASKGFLAPSEIKLKQIVTDVIQAQEDAEPLLRWQGVEIRRYKNQLYCDAPLQPHDNQQIIPWDGTSPLLIESLGLTISPTELENLPIQNHPVTVRFRQGGEKLFIKQKQQHRSLKNILNEAGIPPWVRDRLPLIYVGDELQRVIGINR